MVMSVMGECIVAKAQNPPVATFSRPSSIPSTLPSIHPFVERGRRSPRFGRLFIFILFRVGSVVVWVRALLVVLQGGKGRGGAKGREQTYSTNRRTNKRAYSLAEGGRLGEGRGERRGVGVEVSVVGGW
ncbi:hypothetical protein IE53DRAFT_191179 [Violaceomyces palustris]|uniref:Uncharacterized protein n=1 Tax=Violaceomyces palustris TaxID=1673888 RepID=A0ACD0NS02_9BASI|nr:hypothetical protein IE53DRAFT_191179 [Violaceomyces palustris]